MADPDRREFPETQRGRAGVGDVLAIAAFVALALSLVYVAGYATKHLLLGRMVPVSRDVVWMSPIAHLIIWGIVVLPATVLAPRLAETRTVWWTVLASVGLACFSVLLPWTQVSRWAAVALSAGVGVAAARLAAQRPTWTLRWCRRGALGLSVLFALAWAGTAAWARQRTARERSALPAAPVGAPNVILLILDTVRASALGLYGNTEGSSPELDSIARTAVVFDRAYSAAPWTLPSHTSMFTGEYAGRHSTNFATPFDGAQRTLAQALSACGYETAGFVGNLHYTAWDSGLSRGFLRYRDYHRSWKQLFKSSWLGQMRLVAELMRADDWARVRRAMGHGGFSVVPKPEGDEVTSEELVDEVLGWQARREPRPFFAFLNLFDAHTPYRPRPEFIRTSRATPTPFDLYLAEIRYVDREVGRLFRALAQRGVLDNTWVIVTADHGELFGEHDLTGHDNSVYREVLHVPLLVRPPGPGVPRGRVGRVVSLRDIAATVTGMTGLRCAGGFPGTSLAPLWGDSAGAITSAAMAEWRRGEGRYPTRGMERSALFALVDSAHQYIFNREKRVEELYATGDAKETDDLAKRVDRRPLVDHYAERLRTLVLGDSAASHRQP